MDKEFIYDRAWKGAFSFCLFTLAEKVLTFSFFCILARLIPVNTFGITATLLAFIESAGIASGSGLISLIFTKNQDSDFFLDTLFTFSVLFGIFLMIIFLSCFFLFNIFFNLEEYFIFALILSPIFILNKLAIIQQTFLAKQHKFQTIALFSFIPTLLSFLFTIPIAALKSPLCLPFFYLLQSILQALLFYFRTGRFLNIIFSNLDFSILKGNSLHLSLASIVNLVNGNAIIFLTSYFFGATTAGFYTLCARPASIIWQIIGGSFSKVILPSLSSLKASDGLKLDSLFFFLRPVFFIAIPISIFSALNSHDLLIFLYGSSFSDFGFILIYSLASLVLFLFCYFADSFLILKGRTHSILYLAIIKLFFTFLGFLFLHILGFKITLLYTVILTSFISLISLYLICLNYNFKIKSLLNYIFQKTFVVSLIWLIFLLPQEFIFPNNPKITFLIKFILFFMTFPVFVYFALLRPFIKRKLK